MPASFLTILALLIAPASSDQICNTATGSVAVELSTDVGFTGLFKYTITLDKQDEDEHDDFVQQSVVFYTPLPPGDAIPHSIILVDDLDDDDHDGIYDDPDEEDGYCTGERTARSLGRHEISLQKLMLSRD